MIIVDTGFWLALANREDQYHDAAKQLLAEIKQPLITTWPVLTETCHLLLQRIGNHAQLQLMENLRHGLFDVFELKRDHYIRIYKLMNDYADLPMDLADASLVILAKTLDNGDILSTDKRDFKTYRWKRHKPFNNLLPL